MAKEKNLPSWCGAASSTSEGGFARRSARASRAVFFAEDLRLRFFVMGARGCAAVPLVALRVNEVVFACGAVAHGPIDGAYGASGNPLLLLSWSRVSLVSGKKDGVSSGW